MTFLVPAAILGSDPDAYIYLYSQFGTIVGNNAGFEEWATREGVAPPPVDPSSLSGFVFSDLNGDGIFDEGDQGIADVLITLRGTNDLGENIVLQTRTDATGFYQFTNLRPGTYRLEETQPLEYDDGEDTIGDQGGQTANDLFFDILLAAGVNGQNNNFGEIERTAPN